MLRICHQLLLGLEELLSFRGRKKTRPQERRLMLIGLLCELREEEDGNREEGKQLSLA